MPGGDDARMRDELSALQITVAAGFGMIEERTTAIGKNVEHLMNRPPPPAPGVPTWVLLVLTAPSYVIGVALIILTIWRIQHGG